jgi:predicted metal-binding membrane protein
MGKVYDEFATRTYLYPNAAGLGNRVVGDPDLAVQDSTGHGWWIDHGNGVALLLAIWVVMMVAMMVPSALPAILAVAQAQRDTRSFRFVFANPWVFVGAYLLIWTLFGGLAYLGALTASEVTQQVPWIMMNAARIGGGILVLAGIYQLTSPKRICLAKCRARLRISSSIPRGKSTPVPFGWG